MFVSDNLGFNPFPGIPGFHRPKPTPKTGCVTFCPWFFWGAVLLGNIQKDQILHRSIPQKEAVQAEIFKFWASKSELRGFHPSKMPSWQFLVEKILRSPVVLKKILPVAKHVTTDFWTESVEAIVTLFLIRSTLPPIFGDPLLKMYIIS